MESLKAILNPHNSKRQTASETNSVMITAAEAKERGIPSAHPAPPPDVCQFCGRAMFRKGIIVGGIVCLWQPFPERCTCDSAVEYWKQYDAEQEVIEKAEAERKSNIEKQEYIARLIGESGIKQRFLQRTFEHFIQNTPARTKAYNAAKHYADNFSEHKTKGEGLYIEGTNGTGKTHLAAAIALQLIQTEHTPVICKTAGDLLNDIKKAFSAPGVLEHEVLAAYKSVDLLIIDDLGKEQCSDWSISTLYAIINERYEDMKPTIITTNYNATNLIQALTPKGYDNLKATAIVSRLHEVNRVITMAWEDYRNNK